MSTFIGLVGAAGVGGVDGTQVQGHQEVGARGCEREVRPFTFLTAVEESGINEKLHVVTDRALRQVGIWREVANAGAIHALRSSNCEQKVQSGLVAEGFELLCELCCVGRWCNNLCGDHEEKYILTNIDMRVIVY